MAVRQHLAVLHGEGLVDFTDSRRQVGRPARVWQLTPNANDRYPDSHAEIAVDSVRPAGSPACRLMSRSVPVATSEEHNDE